MQHCEVEFAHHPLTMRRGRANSHSNLANVNGAGDRKKANLSQKWALNCWYALCLNVCFLRGARLPPRPLRVGFFSFLRAFLRVFFSHDGETDAYARRGASHGR